MSRNRTRRRSANKEMSTADQKMNFVDRKSTKVPHNDPEWYIYDKEMFDGVISMPTLEFKGLSIPWRANRMSLYADPNYPIIEGIKTIKYASMNIVTATSYMMNPGLELQGAGIQSFNSGDYSAINVASRKMYAELSASNAKTSQYAPQDIATLILALGQVIAISEHLKRVYGIAKHFNFYSRHIPEHILTSMRISYSGSYLADLSEFRSELNQAISKIDTIIFPAGLAYFKKCKYIYQNLFVDRDEKMVTYHSMAPYSTWILDEESNPQGSVLKTVTLAGKTYMDQLRNLETMIEAILTSSTFNYIFADIINLANRNVLQAEGINIEPLPIDYTIEPIYSEQFNWQVMNMTIFPIPNGSITDPGYDSSKMTPSNDVLPNADKSTLVYSPYARSENTADVNQRYKNLSRYIPSTPIRLPDTNPSHDLFVELLAYHGKCKFDNTQKETPRIYLEQVPDYYCVGMILVTPTSNTPRGIYYRGNANIELGSASNAQISAWQSMVHAPFLGLMTYNDDNTQTYMVPLSRLSAFTYVDDEALSNLRYQTYLGLMSFKK